jgi:hypothetical protein
VYRSPEKIGNPHVFCLFREKKRKERFDIVEEIRPSGLQGAKVGAFLGLKLPEKLHYFIPQEAQLVILTSNDYVMCTA